MDKEYIYETDNYAVVERAFEDRHELAEGQFANYHVINKSNYVPEVMCSTMNQGKATCKQMQNDQTKLDEYLKGDDAIEGDVVH